MNKTQLIDALAERLGDKKIAAAAVEGLVDLVIRTVNGGDKVTITGFGVFEKRTRAARMARNPRTGESVKIKKTSVPAFRPGTLFREVVSGARTLPRVGASANGAGTARPAAATTSPLPTSTAPTGPSTTPARATVAERPTEVPAAKPETKPTKPETKPETKTAIKARKATAKAAKSAKAAKKESKTATKAPTSAPINAAPTTVTARKAVRKSAIKK